jgi:hypothetical protein
MLLAHIVISVPESFVRLNICNGYAKQGPSDVYCFFALHSPSQRRSWGQSKMRGCMLHPARVEHPAATQVVHTSRPVSPHVFQAALL